MSRPLLVAREESPPAFRRVTERMVGEMASRPRGLSSSSRSRRPRLRWGVLARDRVPSPSYPDRPSGSAPMTIASSARIEISQLSVAYRSSGKGPTLVLLHGFLCDSRVWRRELEDLSDRFRVVAWDAPGAGESSDPPDTFTITDWAFCLAGFLDALGIERAHVLGLSWGGLLAQELYRLHTERA